MTTCWACETELRPEWKFCIQCGVPVETDSALARQARERTLGPLAMFGWIFASLGGTLLVAGVIIYLVAR